MKMLRSLGRTERWIGLAVVTAAFAAALVVPLATWATISGQVRATVSMTDSRTVGGATIAATHLQDVAISLANGTGAGQVTDCATSVRSVTTGNDDMQLDAMTGPFGTVV